MPESDYDILELFQIGKTHLKRVGCDCTNNEMGGELDVTSDKYHFWCESCLRTVDVPAHEVGDDIWWRTSRA